MLLIFDALYMCSSECSNTRILFFQTSSHPGPMAIWENLDFTTFRAHPYGTHYGPAKSPVTCDVTIAIIAFIIAVLLIGVFISAIGNRKGQVGLKKIKGNQK